MVASARATTNAASGIPGEFCIAGDLLSFHPLNTRLPTNWIAATLAPNPIGLADIVCSMRTSCGGRRGPDPLRRTPPECTMRALTGP
jgi:hypothetical protein